MKYFVGLDLSLVKSGVSILDEKGKIVKYGLVESKKTGDKPADELKRILKIRDDIFKFIHTTPKIEVENGDNLYFCIEGVAYLAKSTSLVQLAALNYFIREYIDMDDYKFIIVPPTTLKKFATGKGKSEKDHMILEAYKKYGVESIDNNEADSLFLASVASVMFGKEKSKNKAQEEVINLLKKQI